MGFAASWETSLIKRKTIFIFKVTQMSQQSVLSDNSIIVAKARTVGVCFNAILEKQLIAKLLLFRGRHFRPVFVDHFCVVAEYLASWT